MHIYIFDFHLLFQQKQISHSFCGFFFHTTVCEILVP